MAKRAVEKGTVPELRDLEGPDRRAALRALELAAFVGSRFELQPICAALGQDVKSIARLFAELEDAVEDLEGDDEFRFRRLTDIEGLKRRGRVAPNDPDPAPRLRQCLRNDLVDLVSAHAERLADGDSRRTKSVGIVLRLAAAALEGGVPADRLAGPVTAAANALGALVDASLPGASLMEGHLARLLQSDGWAPDARCALAVALLRLEDRGIRTHHALPHETALEELGKVEGDRDIESDRSADELRLEIAQRCAMHVPSAKVEIWRTASGHERLGAPLDRVETMLDRLMACATASRIVRGRARAWRATIRYRTARQLQDAAAKLESV
ncbi:MAG: hypothetical protein ACO3UM_19170, partial [Planctomycetota bacterium]